VGYDYPMMWYTLANFPIFPRSLVLGGLSMYEVTQFMLGPSCGSS
jgi:hypothetical protein